MERSKMLAFAHEIMQSKRELKKKKYKAQSSHEYKSLASF